MKLRELTPADAPRCAELEKVLFPGETPWSSGVFHQEMAQPFNFYFGVEGALDPAHESTVLLGYAGIGMMGPAADPEFEIHTIGVDPAHQGRGIGRALLRGLLAAADAVHATVYLEVRTDNDPARALYESEGFTVVGLRRRYYRPSGADAHTMRRERR